jgi:small nuclear ribonucleoprotein (snRNP)-like protein
MKAALSEPGGLTAMTVRIISKKRDSKEVMLKLVDGSTIKGKINLYHDEFTALRVSDLFTKIADPFIVIYDAAMEGKEDRVVVVNKSNIVWVSPED